MANLLHYIIWIFMRWQLSECNMNTNTQRNEVSKLKIMYSAEGLVSRPGNITKNSFIPIIPDHCQNQNICEDVPNYPHEYMDGVIKEQEEHGFIWQSNEDSVTLSKLDEGSRRIVDICPSKVKNTTPLAAKDGTGQWHFVINQKGRSIQSFRVEVCRQQVVGNPCGEGLQGIDVKSYGGYSLLCKQEFLGRILSCLDEEGKVVNIATDIASCCSCAVYRRRSL